MALRCVALQVSWPLSLILSRQALIKYQILFRHLFFCKHVERQLCSTWQDQQITKQLDLGRAMARSYALRQRMLHFVQNLIYYITVEVLEPRWHSLIVDIKKAGTVDDVSSNTWWTGHIHTDRQTDRQTDFCYRMHVLLT